ncbi:MAG: PKD domain-containing protein [bacterium]|nr:PKD domain-containing protein [bacterium]
MSRKKLLLIGFIIIILIAIPITIFLIKQQQETRSRAEKATNLSLEPVSTEQTPLQKNPGDPINFDVVVDPGTNLVSFVKLEILYDPAKLATGGATPQESAFVEDTSVMTLLEGPVYTDGKIVATLSVGVDPTKVIQTKTKIATLTFTALDGTGTTPTQVSFGTTTQVLSAGPNDEANENVLAGTQSAFVAVAGEPTATATPTPTLAAVLTPSVSITVTPTLSITTTPAASSSPTPTGGTGTVNTSPVCSALNLDRAATGNAPFSITFTATGSDADGTVSKVTFSYGDGQVDNITQGGGIGTNTVNASAAHTYQNEGSYTASAVLTDNSGGVSSGTCTQTITVNAAGSSSSGGSSSSEPTPTTAVASLPATGPGDSILGIGAIVGLLTTIGAFIFFTL